MNHTTRTTILALVAWLACAPAFADLTAIDKPRQANSQYSAYKQIAPQAIAATTTTVVSTALTTGVYIDQIVISVPTTAGLIISAADRQGSAIPMIPTITTSTTANTIYVIAFPANYYCIGGFTITANATGAYFYASWFLP